MAITKHKLQTLNVALTAAFTRGLQGGVAPKYELFTTTLPMGTGTVEAPIAGQVGPLREWTGARQIQTVVTDAYKMTAKTFEKTLAVKREVIADDNVGVIMPTVEQLGYQARVWPDQQVFKALEANGTGYDDVAMFATTHPEGGTTAANLAAGGNPSWYLMDCSKPTKAMIWGLREAAALTARTNLDDPHVFNNNEFLWGVYARGVAVPGFWQYAYKSKLTLDATNYESAMVAMSQRVDDEGENLDIRPTHLFVPPSLANDAKRLFGRAVLASGESNIHEGEITVVVCPRLTGA